MCDGLVEIAGETLLYEELDAGVLLGGHGLSQPNSKHKTGKNRLEGYFHLDCLFLMRTDNVTRSGAGQVRLYRPRTSVCIYIHIVG